MPEFTEKDRVLDKAGAYLKGDLTLEQAKQEAQAAKEKKEAAKSSSGKTAKIKKETEKKGDKAPAQKQTGKK